MASEDPQPAATTTQAATTMTDATNRQTEVAGIPSLRADQSEDLVEPGRYVVLGPGFPDGQRSGGWPEAVIVTVPEGWSSASRPRGGGLHSADVSLELGSVANVVADPCPQDLRVRGFDPPALLDPPVGPTVDELAWALGSIPGVGTTAPVEVASSGESWYGWSLPGWIHRLWILDVAGQRFVIDAASGPEATGEDRLELLRVSSIEIQP